MYSGFAVRIVHMKTLFCKDLVSCVSLSKTYVSLFVLLQ